MEGLAIPGNSAASVKSFGALLTGSGAYQASQCFSGGSGDNSTSSLQDPNHVYTKSGTYPVTLTVTDNHGHRATTSQNVSVTANKPPTSSCTWDNLSGGNTVNFSDASTRQRRLRRRLVVELR